MKPILTLIASAALLCSAGAFAQNDHSSQDIVKQGTQESAQGSDQFFTGKVRIDPLFSPTEEMNVSGGLVAFDAGARSAWHTHPAGQTLIVMSGKGWTQVWGGPIEEINEGDVVNCPKDVKHWHGASPDSPMSHLAITGYKDGKNVEWMEKVTDEQYRK